MGDKAGLNGCGNAPRASLPGEGHRGRKYAGQVALRGISLSRWRSSGTVSPIRGCSPQCWTGKPASGEFHRKSGPTQLPEEGTPTPQGAGLSLNQQRLLAGPAMPLDTGDGEACMPHVALLGLGATGLPLHAEEL